MQAAYLEHVFAYPGAYGAHGVAFLVFENSDACLHAINRITLLGMVSFCVLRCKAFGGMLFPVRLSVVLHAFCA
jgi:hypothetical protein